MNDDYLDSFGGRIAFPLVNNIDYSTLASQLINIQPLSVEQQELTEKHNAIINKLKVLLTLIDKCISEKHPSEFDIIVDCGDIRVNLTGFRHKLAERIDMHIIPDAEYMKTCNKLFSHLKTI